jgi:hypothetical protein
MGSNDRGEPVKVAQRRESSEWTINYRSRFDLWKNFHFFFSMSILILRGAALPRTLVLKSTVEKPPEPLDRLLGASSKFLN